MRTISDIRDHNLRLLIEQVTKETGRSWGAISELSRRTGVPNGLLSQLLRGVSNAESGSRRTIGDETARKLELGMLKNPGWMDRDHGLAHTAELADHIDAMMLLDPVQQQAIITMAAQMAAANTRAAAAAPQPPDSDPPKVTRIRRH